ncbi:MAG: UbiA family prenyltransferase [Verrucomicrobiales bacterium]|nr:UbiA family prenyltransferase [Verrucomicrobiales bacterium]
MLEYLRVCRPDHWLKNVFILFGHAAAVVLVPGVWQGMPTLLWALFSLVPACLIASANYILNEILDAPFDRLHPTKCRRGVAAGLVKVPVLWGLKAALIAAGFGLSLRFFDGRYTVALLLLLLSGLVYNVPPLRLKDRAFLDVIAESFNNPIRLWLGWYALVPDRGGAWPGVPLTIVLAWWSFGALLMTGKRYAEFRFIGDDQVSGSYRKSFRVYTNQSLVIAMITYANLFCFCAGLAVATRRELHPLIWVFPMILLAIIAYFRHAMSEIGARLEPEQLLKNPWIITATIATTALSAWLLHTEVPVTDWLGIFPK